ncbi:hypothetical protein [Streptomyces roseicoloratus]|uniref:hypothetical protein n=1 Tax=Streptomyces roseicoloratus TaxID=2508722 RepID=UPI001009BF03|nr:hypothetical protein [Streptomyces roseicoloratus]
MRRGLVHALAWSLATGAAVTLSWWGVHTVLAGTVYDPPRALPIPSGATAIGDATAGTDPMASATPDPGSPTTAPTATPSTARPATTAATAPADRPAAPRTTAPGGSGGGTGTGSGTASGNGSGDVKSYGTDGGRVVFDLGPSSAELVSAVPGSGWQMQVWKQPTWIRVTFTKDSREISVFCLWHDTAPRVEIDER